MDAINSFSDSEGWTTLTPSQKTEEKMRDPESKESRTQEASKRALDSALNISSDEDESWEVVEKFSDLGMKKSLPRKGISSTQVEEDWEVVDSSCAREMKNSIQRPIRNKNIFSRTWNTVRDLCTPPPADIKSSFPRRGEKLKSGNITDFLVVLQKQAEQDRKTAKAENESIVPFVYYSDLIFNKMINKHSLNDLKKIVGEMFDPKFGCYKKGAALCLPIVIKGGDSGMVDHIVAVLLKDQAVEYFDSMAKPSNKIRLNKTKDTLRNFLEHLANKYKEAEGCDKVEIYENKAPIQQNIHACGIYVAHFFNRRLNNGLEPLMGSTRTQVKSQEVEEFRRKMDTMTKPERDARKGIL